jgi:hypothetical protein
LKKRSLKAFGDIEPNATSQNLGVLLFFPFTYPSHDCTDNSKMIDGKRIPSLVENKLWLGILGKPLDLQNHNL